MGRRPKENHDTHRIQLARPVLTNECFMKLIALGLLAGCTLMCACVPQTIQVKPLRVEPIHMTVDVNIHDHVDAGTPSDKVKTTGQ
jgi:uncharacterized lipoprotein YajG